MNPEDIQFRAWMPKEKVMLEVYLIDQTKHAGLEYYNTCRGYHGNNIQVEFTYDNAIWLRYTGHVLGDRKLYEGDIIRQEEEDDEPYHAVVTWIKEWCMFATLVVSKDWNEHREYLEKGVKALDETMFWTFPIQDEKYGGSRTWVGNIYQNPDLIEVK